jgi:hypothetical protein
LTQSAKDKALAIRRKALEIPSRYDPTQSEFNNVYKNMSKTSQNHLMAKAFFGVKGNIPQQTIDDYQRELKAYRKYQDR